MITAGFGLSSYLLFAANLNKYNNKMEHSKSQKPLAYAYKPSTGKSSLQDQHKKLKRNSTGNLYEQIIEQSRSQDKNYYQQLIKRNEKEQQKIGVENLHCRKKSNADIVIQNARERIEKTKEERETMYKPNKSKQVNESSQIQQLGSKNAQVLNKKSKGKNQASHTFSNAVLVNFYKQEPQKSDESFLQNLNNYLEDLSQNSDFLPQMRCNQKLSETMKIGGREGEARLIAKLEQYNLKIKELKLKNYYQEKEINRQYKKQRKMNDCLFEMFDEITALKKRLTFQQRERMKLEKLIQNFEIRRKPKRRTIGKHYQLSNEDHEKEFNTESEYDREQQSSFHQFIMKKSLQKVGKGFTYDRNDFLDSEKVEKMFRSKFNSDEYDE